MLTVGVQQADFDQAVEYAALRRQENQEGAIVTFTGLVRDFNLGNEVSGLFLEHYPGMTEKVLTKIAQQAQQQWPLLSIIIKHRVGQLNLGDQIVFVGVSSQHREAAFSANQFIMDKLKTQAPFWKKEAYKESASWLDMNEKDREAAKKW